MKKSLSFLLLALLFLAGCNQPQRPAPTIMCTRLENDVFQFQYDNGQALDMGIFLNYLNDWLKDHPEVTAKSIIPQVTDQVRQEGKNTVTRTVTNGVLVFGKVDYEMEKVQNERRAKEAAAKAAEEPK